MSDDMSDLCGVVLTSYDGEQVRCVRPKGHKGWHKTDRAGERKSSELMARFVRRSFERHAARTQEQP